MSSKFLVNLKQKQKNQELNVPGASRSPKQRNLSSNLIYYSLKQPSPKIQSKYFPSYHQSPDYSKFNSFIDQNFNEPSEPDLTHMLYWERQKKKKELSKQHERSSLHSKLSQRETLVDRNASYNHLQVSYKNASISQGFSEKQHFHRNVVFPLITKDSSYQQLPRDRPFQLSPNVSFQRQMVRSLERGDLDKAVDALEQEFSKGTDEVILRTIKESSAFKEIVREAMKEGGRMVFEENGVAYDMSKDEDIKKYFEREFEVKEKMYDIDDNQLVYNRRQLKYLFSQLIEGKFEQKMKPKFEQLLQQEAMGRTSLSETQSQDFFKRAKKIDLFNPSQVMEYYNKSRQFKKNIAVEEELKEKIVSFASRMELDKNKDYEKLRKKFHLSYKFAKEVKQENDQSPKKKMKKYLSQVRLKHEEVDHNEKEGRGDQLVRLEKVTDEDDEKILKERTTFNQEVDVDRYYLGQDNYKDDVPFDLYNMVSLSKRIDFKTKLDLQELKDVTRGIVKQERDAMNKLKDVNDLALKYVDGEEMAQTGPVKSGREPKKRLDFAVGDAEGKPKEEKSIGKYNKWYINQNERFIKQINLSNQPGTKIFDPSKYKNVDDLKNSGYIPYFRFGKFTKIEIEERPELAREKERFDAMMAKIQRAEGAQIYRKYLDANGLLDGTHELPNYIKKLKAKGEDRGDDTLD